MRSLAQLCETLQNSGNTRSGWHSRSQRDYMFALQNYVTVVQNYATPLQNYVIPLQNYVKPYKTVGILDQDRICDAHDFPKKS